jgi:acyl dehydratase
MKKPTTIKRQVVAHNDATDSGNPMHDDAAARALNFKGALVPGITVFGYMTHSLIERFGVEWLDQGFMQVRFRRPVYAGETLTIETHDDDTGQTINIEVQNPDGELCVVGRGSMHSVSVSFPEAFAPLRKIAQPKWPATRSQFEREKVLGSLEATFLGAEATEFLQAMQDDQSVYQTGTTHPAWLLRQANIVVDRNFDLGPWIHVESEIQNHARAKNDERIEVRAQVVDLYEKKGHEYFDLDVAILADGDPNRLIMRVLHRAIYKMAGAD